jgi:hypothetical protein
VPNHTACAAALPRTRLAAGPMARGSAGEKQCHSYPPPHRASAHAKSKAQPSLTPQPHTPSNT